MVIQNSIFKIVNKLENLYNINEKNLKAKDLTNFIVYIF